MASQEEFKKKESYIEYCRKIDHIFSATYQNLRPEETRPFGISSPMSRNQQRTQPKTTEGFDQLQLVPSGGDSGPCEGPARWPNIFLS
jgi:hypothetical protein